MKKRSKFKQNRLSTRNFFSLSNRKLFMIFYFKKHFSKKYLTLNGFQRNVFLRFLKLTSLRFLGFSKSSAVSYRGVSYNRILSVISKTHYELSNFQPQLSLPWRKTCATTMPAGCNEIAAARVRSLQKRGRPQAVRYRQ